MKLIFTLFLSLFIFISQVQAQLTEKFAAKDGLSTAIEYSGMTDANIVMIGTTNATINNIPLVGSLDVKPDLTTGKSNAWSYILRSASTGEVSAYGVVKVTGIGFWAMQLDLAQFINSGIPFDTSKTIDDTDWIDSGELPAILTDKTDFMDFLDQHPNPDQVAMGLYVNIQPGIFEVGQPYWISTASAGEDQETCGVQAYDKTTACRNFSDVPAVTETHEPFIYPNPVNEILKISSDKDINEVLIMDNLGRIVKEDKSGNTELDLSGLAPGNYFVKIDANKVYIKRIVVL